MTSISRNPRMLVVSIMSVLLGSIVMLEYFVKVQQLSDLVSAFVKGVVVVGGFAMIVGVIRLGSIHMNKVAQRAKGGWPYSLWILVSMAIFIVVGLAGNLSYATDDRMAWLYASTLLPISTGVKGIMAFYIASACIRTFVSRNVGSALLLITGIIAMLSSVPLGDAISPSLPAFNTWSSKVISGSALRGLVIASAMGMILWSLHSLIHPRGETVQSQGE